MKYFLLTLASLGTIFCFSISRSNSPEWHMVNVNNVRQGDAHLLIDNGIHVLIDVGSPEQGASHLVPYLRERGITTVQHLFISHPHTDHYGGIIALANAEIRIENIYYNLPAEGSDDFDYKRDDFLAVMERLRTTGAIAKDISKNFRVTLPSSKLTVLHAQKDGFIGDKKISVNDYSMIMQWDAGNYRVLFTGDLDSRLGEKLSQFEHFKADILKIPHHGVTSVAPDKFFDTVSPSLAMFPSTKTLWLHPRGAQVKSWTISNEVHYCHNGLNRNVILKISDRIIAASENPSNACPNGDLGITPGKKIEERLVPSVLPTIVYLIDN